MLRQHTVQLICKMCILLRFEASATAIPATLFHRVSLATSFAEMEPCLTAMACVFIASKADNCFRKSRDVVNVAHAVERTCNLYLEGGSCGDGASQTRPQAAPC